MSVTIPEALIYHILTDYTDYHYEKNCGLNSVKTNLNHKFSRKTTELAMKKFSECSG